MMRQWISVLSEVPENDRLVLVYLSIIDLDKFYTARYNNDKGGWDVNCCDFCIHDNGVTHWMEMPIEPTIESRNTNCYDWVTDDYEF